MRVLTNFMKSHKTKMVYYRVDLRLANKIELVNFATTPNT